MRNNALAIAIGFAVTAAWAPAVWAISLPSAAILVLALIALRSKRGAMLPSLPVWAPLTLAATGCVQLIAGETAYRFQTKVGILSWAVCACVVWLAGQADTERMLPYLAWFAGAIATVTILVHFTSTSRIFWIFPAAYAQVYGPYVYRNHYAAFAELTLPVALYLACVRVNRRAMYVLIAATLFAAVIVAESRTGFVLCVAEIIVVLALAGRRRLLSVRLAAAIGIALFAGTCTVGVAGLAGRMQEQNPYQVRAEIVKSSVDMWRAHPVLGWGLGTWRTMYPSYARIDPGAVVNEAHNDWVQWPCDGGIFAVIAMLALAAWCTWMGMRSIWGLGASVVFLHALVDYPFQEPSIALVTMLLAGLMTVAVRRAPAYRARLHRDDIAGTHRR